ncbi:MAG: hypothetical protein C5B51_19240 [Terriglobia bacterium]|nr:MAG: hypothetical protein C5B51_19240 [Terriglobia bacterium]
MPSLTNSRVYSRDYPPSLVSDPPSRRGNLTRRNCLNMERNAQEELKAHLMETNEEFRRLATQHSEFAKKLDALEALPHLTYEEELEETRLKKLKLRLKDQMEAILSQYRSQQVA